jgi:hypothetical protein
MTSRNISKTKGRHQTGAFCARTLRAIFNPRTRREGEPPTKAQMRAVVERDIVRRWKKKGV